jgi:hypothetical protein
MRTLYFRAIAVGAVRITVEIIDSGNVSISIAMRAAGGEIDAKPYLAMLGSRRNQPLSMDLLVRLATRAGLKPKLKLPA